MFGLKRLIEFINRRTKNVGHYFRHEWSEEGLNHNHFCYAEILLGPDLDKVCPHCHKEGFFSVGSDYCDFCKYGGTIEYTKNGFTLMLDPRIAEKTNFGAWIDISSNTIAPRELICFSDESVVKVIDRYVKLQECQLPKLISVNIDGATVSADEATNETFEKYIGEKQRISMSILFERSN